MTNPDKERYHSDEEYRNRRKKQLKEYYLKNKYKVLDKQKEYRKNPNVQKKRKEYMKEYYLKSKGDKINEKNKSRQNN